MVLKEKPDFLKLISDTAEVYNRVLSKDAIDTYWEDLAFYELSDIKAALSAHRRDVKHGKFMPKPAEIISNVPKREEFKNLVAESAQLLDYKKYLSEKEHLMTCKMPGVDKEKFQDAYEFLRGMRELLTNVQLGHITSPLYCAYCSNYAVYYDWKNKKLFCMGHYSENLK